jgi:hypothetical protein
MQRQKKNKFPGEKFILKESLKGDNSKFPAIKYGIKVWLIIRKKIKNDNQPLPADILNHCLK